MGAWTCFSCRVERDENHMVVVTKAIYVSGYWLRDEEMRYCNDSEKCKIVAEKAREVTNERTK
tara:strand:- start:2614 stop:2802 length:189 start_codon:yes stop_codon:yes gene_type:complete